MEIAVSADYTFKLKKYSRGIAIVPSSATYVVYNSSGTELQSGTASIATDGEMSFVFLAANNGTKDKNFKIVWTYDGVSEAQLFDVVTLPLVCTVQDEDLYTYLPFMRERIFTRSGEATSAGTTTTLIDSRMSVDERDYTGGYIELLSCDAIPARVTSYSSTTGTITFSPALSTATATGDKYVVRESYKDQIDTAFVDYVVKDIRGRLGLAAGFIDGDTVKKMVIYKAIEIWARGMRENTDDRFDLVAKDFSHMYSLEFQSLTAPYDKNDDGDISDAEDKWRPNVASVRIVR